MPLRLRAGLSWCICSGRAVFLDLARDRYFVLPEDLDPAFRAWAADGSVSQPWVGRMLSNGLLVEEEGSAQAPATCPPAVRDLAQTERAGALRLTDVVAAGVTQLQARLALCSMPLEQILTRMANRKSAQSPGGCGGQPVRIANAFRSLAIVLRAEDQCLPRAIATKWMCDRRAFDSALVFGVRLYPFAAHSWVQAGDAVVVGDIEQVQLFTPILVVP